MINYISFILFIILSFLIGGIPFGLIIGKIFKKIDIRNYGSGNIGATNVARVIGFKYALITFILDGLKSFLPVLFAKFIFSDNYIIFVLSSVLGHIFSIWLKFKGGKGISSTMFALLALDYRLFLIMSMTWLFCFKITKISALAALTSVSIVSISSYFLKDKFTFFILLILTFIIFFTHRKNIVRMFNNEELGFNKKK